MSDDYKAFLWDGLAIVACCYAVWVAVTALLTFL